MSMSSLQVPYYSPEQYLELERAALTKSEYLDGKIYPMDGAILGMAGASERHNLIVANLVGELRAAVKGRSCRTYPSDMKVEVGPKGLFAYPDVSVVCGQPRFHDDVRDMLLNPTLIVEVLSSSTEAYDRGAKFAQYRKISTLTDVLFVSTDTTRVEHFSRQPNGQWLLSDISDIQDSVEIVSIDCELAMSEIYALVEFDGSAT
jgi:Uma2 family endonuclease